MDEVLEVLTIAVGTALGFVAAQVVIARIVGLLVKRDYNKKIRRLEEFEDVVSKQSSNTPETQEEALAAVLERVDDGVR